MRRKDKEITDKKTIEEILAGSEICRIAISDKEAPYIVPFNYGYRDNCLYFHSAPAGKKIDLLRLNNRVCFEIEYSHKIIRQELSCGWTSKYRSVIGYGTVDIIEDAGRIKDGLGIIMSHYGSEVNLYDEKNLSRMVLLQLRIDSISGKQSGDWELPRIAIVSSSVRTGRNSHRVALFFRHFLKERKLAIAEILDLQSYNFPLFEERLPYQESPSEAVLDFAGRIKSADGVIIVTPEYNGGYPASLKNAIDLLTEEWRRKPVAISTVSDGAFGGTQVITSLQFSLWKMKAWTVPAMFPVLNAHESFDAEGIPADKHSTEKRAAGFVQELLWSIEATGKVPR